VVAELSTQERLPSLYSGNQTGDDALISNMLGSSFSYDFRPAVGTQGEIIIAWRSDAWSASHPTYFTYALTVRLCHVASKAPWWLTVVYGPQGDHAKVAFVQELCNIRAGHVGPWLVEGDFNLIYKAEDKNNQRLNRWLVVKFW
jgi:hypothetical protein